MEQTQISKAKPSHNQPWSWFEYDNSIFFHVWCLYPPAAVMMEVLPSMLQFSLVIPGCWVHCWMLAGTCVSMMIRAGCRRTGQRQARRRTVRRSVLTVLMLLWFCMNKMQHRCLCHVRCSSCSVKTHLDHLFFPIYRCLLFWRDASLKCRGYCKHICPEMGVPPRPPQRHCWALHPCSSSWDLGKICSTSLGIHLYQWTFLEYTTQLSNLNRF